MWHGSFAGVEEPIVLLKARMYCQNSRMYCENSFMYGAAWWVGSMKQTHESMREPYM